MPDVLVNIYTLDDINLETSSIIPIEGKQSFISNEMFRQGLNHSSNGIDESSSDISYEIEEHNTCKDYIICCSSFLAITIIVSFAVYNIL